MESPFPIVVIGGAAGALTALTGLVASLPAGLPAPLLVVVYTPADQPSYPPQVPNNAGVLPARHPQDGELPRPGQIYVAPPNFHLLVQGTQLELSRGPRENLAPPACSTNRLCCSTIWVSTSRKSRGRSRLPSFAGKPTRPSNGARRCARSR